MSLIEFTQEKLVDGVNTTNNLTLTLADVVFSKPKDNTSGVYNGETLIRMKARSTGQIDGTSVFGFLGRKEGSKRAQIQFNFDVYGT